MELNLNNITFIIVCFKSEEVIFSCLNSLPKKSKKIVIENSKNIKLKEQIELKYDNIEVVINENLGMGASNNKGILMSTTQFVYVLNPDTRFLDNTFDTLISEANHIDDFAIISPVCNDRRYPNFKIYNKKKNLNNQILDVDSIDGYSMLINKNKFNNIFFDENIFLYLENDDICMRAKKNNQKIYIIKNSYIEHLGSSSSNIKNSNEFDYLRNWHWMWSKYYFNKKHYGTLFSIFKIFPNFISALIKFLVYLIIFNTHKKNVYKMRLMGILSSILGKRSFFRVSQ